ncbi:MAG: hypothetical protein ACKOPG_13695 [Novosphingobium sp.]
MRTVSMRRSIALALMTALLSALAACSDDSREAGGVTRTEAQALDDAAAMVDQRRLPAQAASPPAAAEPSPTAS